MKRLAILLFLAAVAATAQTREIRIGIMGMDMGHASIFAAMLNDPNSPTHIPGARVVAGYAFGSDLAESQANLKKVPVDLHDKFGVEIVTDIPTFLSKVDAIMVEGIDGRSHLEEVKLLVASKKPIFIDKPLAASYKDAKEIARLAEKSGTPWFSASSLRYAPALTKLKTSVAGLQGASTYGPAVLEPTNPGFFWYGIHATEMLFTLLGPGCQEVTDVHTENIDIVVGRWSDGRLGVVRGIRKGTSTYGAMVFGAKADEYAATGLGSLNYPLLLAEVVKFFETRVPPVPNAETLEIMAFMEAAEASRKAGGTPVKLSELP